MRYKHIFVVVLVLIGVGSVFFLFHRAKSNDDNKRDPMSPAETAALLRLHPLASLEKIAEAEQQPVSTWEEWAKARAEIDVAKIVLEWAELPASVANLREINLDANRKNAVYFQAVQMPPPKTAVPITSEDYAERKARELAQRYYQGPQTPDALISEFGEKYLEEYPKSSEWDTHYPVEDWLQNLLNKGVEFKEFKDYSYYVGLRRNLIRLKDKPDQWQSGNWGIPITNNFETYEEGYIDRKIWEDSIVKQVRSEYLNEPLVSVFFPSHHPEKYLPTIGETTFVRRKGDAMSTWGAMLTKEQMDNLLYKGIEPEDVEIVYIDDEYNILSEKPKVYNSEEWIKEKSYITEFDGIPITPENYEKLLGEPMLDQWEKWYKKEHAEETPIPVEPSSIDAEAAREAASAAQETAKAEFEKFQQGMRQIEEFATLSDAEIEKSLENQFRQKFLPQHPLEQLEHFTPERLEKALGTLFQHGFDEGFRRISRDSPALAEQLKQYFGQGQKPPAGKLPKGPVPPAPEAAPPESDTD